MKQILHSRFGLRSPDSGFPRRCFPTIVMLLLAGMSWQVSGAEAASPTVQVPEEVRSQWKFNPKQISLRWDAEGRTLTFRQSVAQAVIHGPGDLYRLAYRVAFEADVEESTVLLVLGNDGNPTHLTSKILTQNEATNPQVCIINSRGMIFGAWLGPSFQISGNAPRNIPRATQRTGEEAVADTLSPKTHVLGVDSPAGSLQEEDKKIGKPLK